MTWFGWVVIGWFGFNCLATAALVGRERKPIDGGTVVVQIIISTLFILGVVLVGTNA